MKPRREPHREKAANIAKRVLSELPVLHPAEAEIDTLAFLRGALVYDVPIQGARARLTRGPGQSIIAVREGLRPEQRRFAIAHELGHLEVHRNADYFDLCTAENMAEAYANSGHEGEANAFASEFLMPERLVAKMCDVKNVSLDQVRSIASEFQVSLTAAGLRFVYLCPERTALVCSYDRKVEWTWRGSGFGGIRMRGSRLDSYSLAIDHWEKGRLPQHAESVEASAWVEGTRGLPDDATLREHSVAITKDRVLTLLWIPVGEEW